MKRTVIAGSLVLMTAFFSGCTQTEANQSQPSAASQTQASATGTTPQSSSKPSHLSFRGFRVGQSQEEVWAVVKAGADTDLQRIANDPETYCTHDKRGVSSCSAGNKELDFSREDKLIHLNFLIMSPGSFSGGDNPDEFFPALRHELTAANHEEGTVKLAGSEAQTFAWSTDRTVACKVGPEEGTTCPAEEIDLTEHHPMDRKRCCMAGIDLKDTAHW
jgi:hypothetical protein